MSTAKNFRPEVTPTRENEWIVELSDDRVDSLNRRQFTAHWLGDGPTANGFAHGHRGQVFRTNVDEFVARCVKKGRDVRVVGPLS